MKRCEDIAPASGQIASTGAGRLRLVRNSQEPV